MCFCACSDSLLLPSFGKSRHILSYICERAFHGSLGLAHVIEKGLQVLPDRKLI